MSAKLSRALLILLAFGLMTATSHAAADALHDKIPAILQGDHRSAEHQARDRYRHPAETLAFFELEDDMTVVEIWPGAKGWYTEILAPLLADRGKLIAAHFSPASEVPFFQRSLKTFQGKLAQDPAVYGQVQLTVLQPPDQLLIAPPGSADRVLTFRNVHNWMRNGQAEAVFRAMFKALKAGGILGVVEHRAAPDQPQDPKATSGYVREDYVIDLAQAAGFELLATAEINANPKDTKDYAEGVWSLPPTLRDKTADPARFLQIGESDRMTLKFIKPLTAIPAKL